MLRRVEGKRELSHPSMRRGEELREENTVSELREDLIRRRRVYEGGEAEN